MSHEARNRRIIWKYMLTIGAWPVTVELQVTPLKSERRWLQIARSSKGRLITDEETVSIKVRMDKGTAEQLRKCAEIMKVPMATVIRQGINRVYADLEEGK